MHFTAQPFVYFSIFACYPLLARLGALAQPVAAAVEPAGAPPLLPREASPAELHFQDDNEGRVAAELHKAFDVISTIPDDVLHAGDDATHKWMVDHGHRSGKRDAAPRPVEMGLIERGWWEVAKCAGAIAAFIASNAIGAAKLLRIKKYIEALGGVKKAAELLLKASTNAERLKEGGEALPLLAGEILGTSMVASNC